MMACKHIAFNLWDFQIHLACLYVYWARQRYVTTDTICSKCCHLLSNSIHEDMNLTAGFKVIGCSQKFHGNPSIHIYARLLVSDAA